MKNILLEVGCEEIPARFMPGLLADLKLKAQEKLSRERISFDKIETFGTYRRLTLYVENTSEKQPDITAEIKGPPAGIAFDPDGKPLPPAAGFAKSQNTRLENLFVKENYLFAKIAKKGQKTEKLLPSLLPEIITSLSLPISMRWGSLDFKFIRPIHSILALFGNKIIRFKLAGIVSGNMTPGRRGGKTASAKIQNASKNAYLQTLFSLGVVADQNARKAAIEGMVYRLARKAGLNALRDDSLLNEILYLVEAPFVCVGKFKPDFLSVPAEILVTSMKKHQKYFPFTDKEGKLQPKFAIVTDGCKNAAVARGNEKVLAARLSDAQFFFEEDLKIPFGARTEYLEKISFFENLGNMRQRSDRIEKLSDWLCKRVGLDEKTTATCRRIAQLCKADLTTKMVFEFPELQGIMGQEYARRSGENEAVARGIFEHYLPRFADDSLPASKEGTIAALADRFDSLVGVFSIGCVPTGSEDPYGLRRSVQGIIRIITERKIDLLLDETLETACKLYDKRDHSASLKQNILNFIAGRLRPVLLEKGIRYDVADASLCQYNDILDVMEKSSAINILANKDWFQKVIASAHRVFRIASSAPRAQVFEHDLEEEEEKILYKLYLVANAKVHDQIKKENWDQAARELSALTLPIETFFDKILVMHRDERLKANRLALLKSLDNLYLSVADFKKIVIEGQ